MCIKEITQAETVDQLEAAFGVKCIYSFVKRLRDNQERLRCLKVLAYLQYMEGYSRRKLKEAFGY